jgi:hypothetical protein
MKLKFDSYDSVIVQSIYFGQGLFRTGATLQKIVMMSDALDRSTISYEQIKTVLPKLLTADLIKISGDKIYLTKNYRQLRRQSKKLHSEIEHETDRIKLILKDIEKKEFGNLQVIPDNFLPAWKWTNAHNNYLREFEK